MENTDTQMNNAQEQENTAFSEEENEQRAAETFPETMPVSQPVSKNSKGIGKPFLKKTVKKAKQPKAEGTSPDHAAEKRTGYEQFKHVLGKIVMICYHLRRVVMAAPVIYYALKLAAYNTANLPELVGLNLQANGEFAMQIARSLAVTAPLAITGGCLAMMFLCRKAMYAWAISIFTLVIPIMLLISNQYPA